MKWKSVAKVAKLVACAVVPGAAGYVAYKHVIRPWLCHRAAKGKEAAPPPSEHRALEQPSGGREELESPQGQASSVPEKPVRK